MMEGEKFKKNIKKTRERKIISNFASANNL